MFHILVTCEPQSKDRGTTLKLFTSRGLAAGPVIIFCVNNKAFAISRLRMLVAVLNIVLLSSTWTPVAGDPGAEGEAEVDLSNGWGQDYTWHPSLNSALTLASHTRK